LNGGIAFDWDAENTRHLKRHRVTTDEFEEIITGDPLYVESPGRHGVRREPRLPRAPLEKSHTKQKRVIPAFKTAAEEAKWWYENRKVLDEDLVEASNMGRLKRLSQATLKARLAASKARVVSIRLPENDIVLARRQAAQKGLPYQTYIKSLLHQALRQAR
jgi:predicted DNA binding CopG/RHH family protein